MQLNTAWILIWINLGFIRPIDLQCVWIWPSGNLPFECQKIAKKLYIFFKWQFFGKNDNFCHFFAIGNFFGKKCKVFGNFLEKNVKFLAIFWHSNSNFREGQVWILWHPLNHSMISVQWQTMKILSSPLQHRNSPYISAQHQRRVWQIGSPKCHWEHYSTRLLVVHSSVGKWQFGY